MPPLVLPPTATTLPSPIRHNHSLELIRRIHTGDAMNLTECVVALLVLNRHECPDTGLGRFHPPCAFLPYTEMSFAIFTSGTAAPPRSSAMRSTGTNP